MSDRFLLIGAHLRPEDAAIEGVVTFPMHDLTISAAPYDSTVGAASRDVMTAVAALRQRLVEKQAFVAIRYGASVAGGDEAVSKCAQHGEKWREVLIRFRDTFEMTLKVVASEAPPHPDRKHFRSGAEYLRALHAARSTKSIDQSFQRAVDESFSSALTARWVPRQDAAFEFAFVIPRTELAEVRSRGLELKERFPDVPFLISGPWPLEVFADE